MRWLAARLVDATVLAAAAAAVASSTQLENSPCTIERITGASSNSVLPRSDQPYIWQLSEGWNADFTEKVTAAALLETHAAASVVLSSSNSYSKDRAVSTFQSYVDSMQAQQHATNGSSATETWYMFGENFSTQWKELEQQYRLPPGTDMHTASLSFGIGGYGSGVAFHTHGDGFSEVLVGAKRWLLYPPQAAFSWDPDATAMQWLEQVYPTLNEAERPLECTIVPGEVLYFPAHWHHAIVNVAPYTAFMSTFV
jgi:ribosomal protein L16 Arg81 hydroxylase